MSSTDVYLTPGSLNGPVISALSFDGKDQRIVKSIFLSSRQAKKILRYLSANILAYLDPIVNVNIPTYKWSIVHGRGPGGLGFAVVNGTARTVESFAIRSSEAEVVSKVIREDWYQSHLSRHEEGKYGSHLVGLWSNAPWHSRYLFEPLPGRMEWENTMTGEIVS